MTSRLRIYDRAGLPLVEINATVNRSWKANVFGKAEFEIAISNPKATAGNLRFRNLVYVVHEDLPAWGGYIWTPMNWDDETGVIHVIALGAERLLKLRRSEGKTITDTPGNIFWELVTRANTREDMLIREGEIYRGGVERKYEMGLTESYYDDVLKISLESGQDWSIEPAIDASGRLYFTANWWARRGQERAEQLIQGHNIEAHRSFLSHQGELINNLLGYVNDTTRLEREDTEYRGVYGLIEGAYRYNDQEDQGTLAEVVLEKLAQGARGKRVWRLRARNKSGLLRALQIGNMYTLRAPILGNQAVVRVTGMQYQDGTDDSLDLTVEEQA